MEPITRVAAALAACAALIALVRETLALRSRSSFPLATLFARHFPIPVPTGTPLWLASGGGAASVLIPVAIYTTMGWLEMTSVVATARWIGLALLTVLIKAAWAVAEEIIFRGALLSQIARRIGVGVAVVASAVVFAAVHLSRVPTPSRVSLGVYALDGVIFATLAVRTGSLWAPAAWHATKNLVVWAIGWSGTLQLAGGPMVAHVSGPPLWTGAAHQAGLVDLLTTAMLLGVVLVFAGRRPPLPRVAVDR